jgi:L-alanine-DL-glutamate epimerase-like enolase superfamily enzyme
MADLSTLAESEKDRIHITSIRVYQLKGHGIQSIIRVQTDAGIEGIGEAGLPATVAQSYIDYMSDSLLGQDALEIEKCYANMIRLRAQWHAHWVQNPTISGIEMALWDIAGKVFNQSASRLLTGRFREEIPMYVNNGGPANWSDPIACRDWAQEIKADPLGFRTIKLGFENINYKDGKKLHPGRYHGGQLSKMLTPTELRLIRLGFENVRQALGWEHDIIIHCHNEWDLPTALGIADAVAAIKPLWVEDGLPVMYSDTWKSFRESSPVRVMTGEKLEHPAEFLQFMQNGAVDAIHPDLAFIGGFTGGRKIADLAELFYIPIATHMAGSYVQLIATGHYGASVRNFVMTESRIPNRGQLLYEEMGEEGITVENGNLQVPNGPGLGITLRPEVMNEIIENGRWD